MVKKSAQATPNQLLRRARQERGWTQREVAERIGAPNDIMVTRWESGTVFPSAYYIERLCLLFEQKASDLGLLPGADTVELSSPVENRDAEYELKQPPASIGFVSKPVSSFLLDPAIPQMLRNRDRIVERVDLLQQVKQMLTEVDSLTAIALHGLPGVGKTTLAALLVADPNIQACFPDGILWTGLGPTPNLQGVLLRWAALLGVSVTQSERAVKQEELLRQIHLAIGQRRMLLVIDDAWTEQDALTLHLGGEHSTHLLTTRLPQVAFAFAPRAHLHIPELDAHMGIELLARYVPSLVKDMPKAVDDLVSAVGGLPLALTLLGHYLAAQAFSRQPRRLQTALQRLSERQYRFQISMPLASSERSQASSSQASLSLNTAISLSTYELDEEALRVFYALSVFPPKPVSFSEEAAQTVAQCSPEVLDTLWDKGLLESSEPARYTLHQTIREYAQQQQQNEEIVQRHFVVYIAKYIHTHQYEYAALEQELASIQEALELAHVLQMKQELLTALHDGKQFFRTRGFYHMVEHYLWYAWEVVSKQGNTKEQAIILEHLASILYKLENYTQAKELAKQGLILTDSLDEMHLRGRLLSVIGDITYGEGDTIGAEAYFQEGLQLAKQIQDPLLLCVLYSCCGQAAWFQGQLTQALHYYGEAVQTARQYQYPVELGRALSSLGGLCVANGDYSQAEGYLQEGLLISQQLDQRENMCYLYNNLGSAAECRGDFTRANFYYQQGLEQARLLQYPAFISYLLVSQGTCLLKQCDYIQARLVAEEAIALMRQIKHVDYLWYALSTFGAAIAYVEGYEHGIAYFQESLALVQQFSKPSQIVQVLLDWAEVALFYEKFSIAHEHFQAIFTIDAEKQHYPDILACAYYGLARIALHEQKLEKAHEYAGESLRLFQKIGHYKTPVVQTWIEALAKD